MKTILQQPSQQAEKWTRKPATKVLTNHDVCSPEETRQILHDMHVQQIELDKKHKELRRSQVDLEVSRLLNTYLYDLAPVGYVTLNESGLILQANLTAASLLGVSRSVIVKKPIARFILKNDHGILLCHRKQLTETGSSQAFELRMVTQGGTIFWVRMEISATPDADGKPVCRVVINDISAAKRFEESQRIKSLVFETSLVASCVFGPDGVITEANAAFLRMWGFPGKDEVMGKPMAHFHKNENVSADILAALDSMGQWEGEYVARRRDASTFTAHGLATVLRDENDKIIGYQSAVVDITESQQTAAAAESPQSEAMPQENRHQKQSLLKAIHHRKKKLKTINGLLRDSRKAR